MAKQKAAVSHQLHCGDSVKLLPAKIESGSVNLMVGDFPYNYGQAYNGYKDKLTETQYYAWARQMFKSMIDSLHPHGSLWLFWPDELASDMDVILRREFGLHRQNWVIWGFGFGVHCTGRFSRGHTHILHYTKHKTRHTFNSAAVAVPSDRQALYKDKRAAAGGKTPSNVWMLQRSEMDKVLQPDADLWYESRICGTFKERKAHCPNQIPEPLLSRIVLATSNPGDLVVDPCGGTFSTGVAALRHGRRFVGFDIDKSSVVEGEKRLKGITAKPVDVQMDLFAPAARPKARAKKAK